MDEKQKLIDKIIEQIKEDIQAGDYEALEELLKQVYKYQNFVNYLPENEQQNWF